MSEQMSIGAELARAREAAGMSTAQVSDATRLRRTVVEAIEHDDLAGLGGATYARGHIRVICQVLGIDPAPLLARLGSPTVAETSPHPQSPGTAREESGAGRSLGGALSQTVGASLTAARTGPNWSGVMVGALVLVLGVGAVQVVRSASSSSTAPVAGPSPGVSVSSPAVLPPVGPAPTQPPAASVPPASSPPPGGGNVIAQADGVNVVLTITGSASWVSASGANGTMFEGTLTRGQRKTFKDRKKIKFVFGNAGSVNLVVNGVDVGAPGGEGRVFRTTFGPGDPGQSQA